MAFESIKFTLADKLKAVKSKADLSLVFASEKFKDHFWSAIPHKLLYDTAISPGAKILWLILQNAGDPDGYSYYGQKKLAALIARDERTVQRYTKELTKPGRLIIKTGRRHHSNRYWVIWPGGCPNPKLKSVVKKSKGMEKR